jgi:hypothetical protein
MDTTPVISAASERAAPALTPTPTRALRGLRIDEYSRAQSGVWYYQVDIELRHVHAPESTGCLDSCGEYNVQSYAVRRRYNEFAQLYEKIKEAIVAAATREPQYAVGDSGLPPFPQKELISSSMLGMLWRTSAPTYVLEDRRAKFEALLRWIECHPTLRESSAYVDFLGQPPQVSTGYVSLKEYSSQNWLSSLEKLTKEKAKRRRRLSSDCSVCSTSLPDVRPRSSKKRRPVERDADEPREPSKRQKRLVEPKACSSAATPRQKTRARPRSSSSSDDTPRLLLSGDVDTVAQVESSHKHKKKRTD